MNTQFTFAEYQESTAKTAIYPGQGTALGLVYCALKLGGESGEVLENIGKSIRDDKLMEAEDVERDGSATIGGGLLTSARREKIKKELGDAMWYIAQMCTELGFSMADVGLDNLAKLADRQVRGVLQGSGDNR